MSEHPQSKYASPVLILIAVGIGFVSQGRGTIVNALGASLGLVLASMVLALISTGLAWLASLLLLRKTRPLYFWVNVAAGSTLAITLLHVLFGSSMRDLIDRQSANTMVNSASSVDSIPPPALNRAAQSARRVAAPAASDRPVALGKLVSVFLVASDKSPEWSMGATSETPEIRWQSAGVETKNCGTFSSCRRGTARVVVMGEELQNLRQRLEPVQWTLFMSSSRPAKFGPQQVTLSPSCDTVNCEFKFEEAIADSGVSIKRLCHAGPGPFRQTAYALTQGRKRAVAVVNQSSGSGGDSTSLELILVSDSSVQDWCAEARSVE